MAHVDYHRCREARILRRSASWALILGAITGGLAGTAFVPVIGTALGALIGGFFGLVQGVANAVVLVLAVRSRRPALWACLGSAAGSAATAAVLLSWTDGQMWVVGAAVCAVLGAALGPAVLTQAETDIGRQLTDGRRVQR